MTAVPVASLHDVRHHYGSVAALDRVTLDIPAGVMAGLVGPDGVGKSTLLGLLAGVRRPQEGEIVALGGDLRDPSVLTGARQRIAYMPQGLGRNLYQTLSVAENIDYFARLFGQGAQERRQRIAGLTRATGLSRFLDRPAGKLSGGMKQKLSLCCALVRDPDLLILDEPTTGVDPLSRRQFWTLIDRLRERRPQMSVLVATAYMDEAQRFDWLAAMDAGKVIATGNPAAILERTGSRNLDEAFIALMPEERRRGYQPVVITPPPPPHPGEAPVIEAKGLTRRFGDFVAVDHVNLSVRRGEIFGFLGSNGSGKSTTMRMLTGLLPATEGEARILGQRPGSGGDARRHVGYMSQSFSLYGELTVRQNLQLHADLFHLPRDRAAKRLAQVMHDFDLEDVADAAPESLPLGVRQRLQLAAAVVHEPELLILDEPTSGVDPVARDLFWRHLLRLSREQEVTIFISTHFMNEAERCDRISLQHAGRVLAMGSPAELVAQRHAATLEEAFIGWLEEAAGPDEAGGDLPAPMPGAQGRAAWLFNPRRLLACAWRESLELLRDPIRLAFALLGPVLLTIAFGFGISFDVENLPYAVLDGDRTPESRSLLESFAGSRYFSEQPPLADAAAAEARLRAAGIALAVEIPPGFGHDLRRGDRPEVAVAIDGAMPFRAETARSYVLGLAQTWLRDQEALSPLPRSPDLLTLEPRFHYNQAFRSAVAIVPGVIMLMLMLVPAMLAAVGVVREKESGAIANFRATPVTAPEFLIGKQIPYFAVALSSFVMLLFVARVVFDVPVLGSGPALAMGAALYVLASTGFGLLVSAFVSSQVAAIFAAAILSIVPAVNFSGLLVPAASLTGPALGIGLAFPASWFQQISVGAMSKGLHFAELWHNHLVLAGFAVLFIGAATLLLRKQEP
ncbi:Export ABC transporter permease protein (plasmid) [Roseomonas mucosa]|uniref:Multidrug ABC transporter ATP-binding protein n=4 Tax=Roseomonas mucosa TaxID=207340 RepID=A0A1S8D3R8_9PROT|nr:MULTISPECIES: ribosome-associated ATPase/putative transporter RbbA [Roseomonas]MBS5905302.1 ribosome-associated ATPase/putative transporter RbbA [Acetobacteraceae bacterium]ATR19382.1 ABC transporter ATP-binding protein/permease [Roseomonas sp. FDAARGOS_362]MCG7354364.1 ribosome-associated ATPase/putative transporter RbbA [Roseomonas mucosa]MCG7357968.1 ribosome-associated ATPase/putative transporter RbbA [Roseomonas mucosa]MDT8292029.1 ribosome-associated ATPase/putative transporter RbbA [